MLTQGLLKSKLRVLMMARLFIATFLLFYAQFVFPRERLVFYWLIAVIAVLSTIYLVWMMMGIKLKWLALTQLSIDLALETVLIYYTGGLESLFATIYVLSILSAGFILSPVSSFYLAASSSFLFTTCTYFHINGLGPKSFMTTYTIFPARVDSMYLFYALYVRMTVFFVVAFLSFYFSGMIQKLESRIKTQERLVLLGEVISTIAHEIRNPLASISGSVELIAKKFGGRVSQKESKLLEAMVDESERVKRIFNDLLDYARLPTLKRESIDAESYLEQVLFLLPHQDFFNKKINVVRSYLGKRIAFIADPEYLKQALMNLIGNAYQAMTGAGTLAIDCVETLSEVKIMIRDTGCGMNQKTIQKLFIPFKTTKRGGTGLGLVQANKIVNQHDGQIQVQSKVDEGTLVAVILPKQADYLSGAA